MVNLGWDGAALDDPVIITEYYGTSMATDHNLYVHQNYAFEANYTSGLRIIELEDIHSPPEVAYFDTYPASDGPGFRGAWSVYPFFESGTVVVSSIDEGLFVLQPTGLARLNTGASANNNLPASFTLSSAYPNRFPMPRRLRLHWGYPCPCV